jgi:hypothetical protein
MIIERLSQEHRNIEKLLAILEKLKLQSNIVGRSPCVPVLQAYVKSG